ncbi:hypothetical protein [Streptomyces antibioticus]|uniref:hypothetical protein n=1 Tax=Streptomyces antibioticus TaxID=1890 RepID=UPI0033D18EA6
MNAVVFWALRAVAVVAIVVEVAALIAGETLVLNLAAVLGLGAVAVTWVFEQDGVDR